MCGLFGTYVGEGKALLNLRVLDACRDTLRHRGPDKAGTFQDRGLYLGFRRLAILDLSAQGNQPMTSPDGRYTIIYNGEIYNFLEIRAELERQGEVFRGHSDTEVLIHLYEVMAFRARVSSMACSPLVSTTSWSGPCCSSATGLG